MSKLDRLEQDSRSTLWIIRQIIWRPPDRAPLLEVRDLTVNFTTEPGAGSGPWPG